MQRIISLTCFPKYLRIPQSYSRRGLRVPRLQSLARTQIIQQAGTAMLSQANQQAQSVLALLK